MYIIPYIQISDYFFFKQVTRTKLIWIFGRVNELSLHRTLGHIRNLLDAVTVQFILKNGS